MGTLTTTVFNLYLALVCAVSLMSSVIIAGGGVSHAVSLFFPNSVDVQLTRFDDSTKTEVTRDPAVVAAEKLQREQSDRFYNVRGMFQSFGYLVLCGAVFGLHWRIFRRRVALADMLAPQPQVKSKK